MKQLVLLFICIQFSTQILFAQNFAWIRSLESVGGTSRSTDVTSDDEGNVYVIGHFDSIVDFDPGEGEVLLTSEGGNDVFVLKLSKNGDHMWVRQFGGVDTDGARKIIWKNGLLYISGVFSREMDIDPGSETRLISSSSSSIFVSVLDGDGKYKWSYHCSGPSSPADMKIDEDGSIYLTGSFADSCDFDPSNSDSRLISQGNGDIYVMRLLAGGALAWVRGMGGTFFDVGRQISLDATGVYLSVQYFTRIDIDPGPDSLILPHSPVPGFDAAVVKFDKDGFFSWVKAVETPAADAVSVNPFETGRIYISTMGFIGIYDTKGNFVDTLRYPLPGIPIYDHDGRPIRVGQFRDTVDFDPTEDELIRISGAFSGTFQSDLFFIKYDETFRPSYLLTLSSDEQLLMRAYSQETKGAIYFCSEHLRDMTIADGSTADTIFGVDIDEAFIVKINTCTPEIEHISANACNVYRFGDRVLSSSGQYKDTLVNSTGCDSVIVLNLEIDQLDTNVNVSDGSFVAVQETGTFQWLRCEDNFQPVVGADEKIFIPNDDQNYALQIESGSCIDTSKCISLETTRNTLHTEHAPRIWPNPATNYIEFSHAPRDAVISVFSTEGHQVFIGQLNGSPIGVDYLTPGLYLVTIKSRSSTWQSRFVKL